MKTKTFNVGRATTVITTVTGKTFTKTAIGKVIDPDGFYLGAEYLLKEWISKPVIRTDCGTNVPLSNIVEFSPFKIEPYEISYEYQKQGWFGGDWVRI